FYQGVVMSRRLTRGEYNNTVRDLIGLDLRPADDFPSDGAGGEGFDTTGSTLFSSPILVEKYLQATDKIARAAIPNDDEKDVSPERIAAKNRIVIATPGDSLPPREAAKQSLTPFVERAFRRPIAAEDVEKFLPLFDRAFARGDGYTASLRLAVKGVLMSPQFLFLVEPEAEKDGIARLGPYQLAQRMSYFLWSSMPDEQLLSTAASGAIYDTSVLLEQMRRMLRDPKARALGDNFAMQWLGLGGVGGGVRPDPEKFPEFTNELAASMREEAVLLFASIMQEDRPLLDIIDAKYTFVDERLAGLYGLANVQGPQMRKVELADANRGGVLGMAAMHTVTSYPLRTSPVLRGRWVLEELLGSRVPPPPPGVPALEEKGEEIAHQTLRQRLEKHRTKAECASCHDRMDPLGFGLEVFDPIGRLRTQDAGQPIDSAGKLPSGETFSGPAELKKVLLKRKNEFVKRLTRKMLGYALGRELNRFDDCVVEEAMKSLQAREYKSSALVETIILSYPFQYRFTKK
ncbi:MAG TPA: DUF1592 domain-containing protein, partial [Pirellulales bacterium]